MRRDLRHFELPGSFSRRYRPVRVHPHETGLAAFVLDEYGLRFFRIMATGSAVPQEAVWSVVHAAERPALLIVSGRRDDARGYIVCEVPHASADDPSAYPVPPRLTYRAKVTIAALQALLADLSADPAGSAADVAGIIERRIEKLRT